MKIAGIAAVSLMIGLTLGQTAFAQDWRWQEGPRRPSWQHQDGGRRPPEQRPIAPQGPGYGGGACVPSGFARLSRNCSVNTGGCQRMPDNCSRGWCCP